MGFPDMVFKPHASGLHVYDPEDARGLASYSFMETVESNMALFTKRQIHSANQVCNLQAGLAFPSDSDMTWALQSNMIKDCPLTAKDMTVRTITDFRELNKRIVRRPYPIPKISTTLQELEGFTYTMALILVHVLVGIPCRCT